MKVTVRRGAIVHHYRHMPLYIEWPDGRLIVDGKRITKAQAAELVRKAQNTDQERDK